MKTSCVRVLLCAWLTVASSCSQSSRNTAEFEVRSQCSQNIIALNFEAPIKPVAIKKLPTLLADSTKYRCAAGGSYEWADGQGVVCTVHRDLHEYIDYLSTAPTLNKEDASRRRTQIDSLQKLADDISNRANQSFVPAM